MSLWAGILGFVLQARWSFSSPDMSPSRSLGRFRALCFIQVSSSAFLKSCGLGILDGILAGVLRAGTPEVLGRGAVFELGAATTGTVKLAKLRAVYGDTAVLTCEAGCEFGQIFICYGTAASGGATVPKACPGVSLRGDTCKSCDTITLPAYAAWEMDDWREIGTQ